MFTGHMGTPKRGDKNRLTGFYRGIVDNNLDPKKLGRVRIRCGPLNNVVSGWATQFSSNSIGKPEGAAPFAPVDVPPIGAIVFIFFQDGEVNKPFYMHGWHGEPDGVSLVPGRAREVMGGSRDEDSKTGATPLIPTIKPTSEPYGAKYPDLRMLVSPGGWVFEKDDTDGAERLKISHPSGKFTFEVDKDGNVYVDIQGETFVRFHEKAGFVALKELEAFVAKDTSLKTDGNLAREVGKDEFNTIHGNREIQVEGDSTSEFHGDVEETFHSKLTQTTVGEHKVTGNAKLTATYDGDVITESKQAITVKGEASAGLESTNTVSVTSSSGEVSINGKTEVKIESDALISLTALAVEKNNQAVTKNGDRVTNDLVVSK